jgi:enoyl-CoA hydratase
MLAKKAVHAAFETHLAESVRTERALFLPMFGTEGQREGMAAFTEKRAAIFHR